MEYSLNQSKLSSEVTWNGVSDAPIGLSDDFTKILLGYCNIIPVILLLRMISFLQMFKNYYIGENLKIKTMNYVLITFRLCNIIKLIYSIQMSGLHRTYAVQHTNLITCSSNKWNQLE